jgi:signal peptidase I
VSEDNLSGSPEAKPEEVSQQDTLDVAAAPPESDQPPFSEPVSAAAGEPMLEGAEYGEASLNAGVSIVAVAEAPPSDALAEAFAAPPEMLPVDRPRSTLAEWTITILLLLFLTTTLVQAYVIPTGSMEDTLLIGDHLLVDKLAYAPPGPVSQWVLPYTEVKRGDIIVFRYPSDISQTFVKRAIGVPGDHIRIINKEVYLNGVKLNEPYTYHKTDYIDSYRDNFPGDPSVNVEQGAYDMLTTHVVNGEVVVPPKHYFAMGDNRDNSSDSRFWGFVPRENIIGKPLIIYWSYDAPTEDLNTSSISLRHMLDLGRNFFTKTRWKRTFQLIHGYPLEQKR